MQTSLSCCNDERAEKVNIKHRFDPWHLAKCKNFAAVSKKSTGDLLPWTTSIVNHLLWCAATSGGDQLLCQEKWKSVVYHMADVHEWSDFQLFSACNHEDLTNEQRRNKVWLPIGNFLVPLCLCFKMSLSAKPFDLHENEPTGRTHFHVKGFAFRLILIQRQKATQKWSIGSPAHNALKEVA